MDALRKCILEVETILNVSPKNKAHYESEKEAIHLLLTRIGDEIYSTVDACKTTHEMWEAIERLQQGESLNIQNVKTNLFWEFGKFTSHDGETMELYTTRYKNDNQTGQFRNQMTVNVAEAKKTVGSQVVEQTSIQCFNCKEFEQSDWLADTDEEIDEHELEAHYSFMAKIQEVPTPNSGTDTEPLKQTNQNAVECDDERVALANLITNLELDVNENKKIQNQLKKANTTLAHELTACKSILTETSRTLRESNSIQDSCLIALQNEQTEFQRVYYVEDLNHNLLSISQFCDADLEVAFRKSTCFVRDLQGNDLLTGYSTQSKGYRVYNKRTKLIVESIHLKFDEIKEMSKTSVDHDTSGLIPQRQKASDYDISGPVP
nr:integrase, catalytic region, zinc finger, CCHC-type, peptidase aspartic, catalytic [Tanacetum cinerariifolium]